MSATLSTVVADPPRATRRAADPTRERIQAAALDLFADRSFAGATTRDIAARAGVAQPLVHYHFRTKEALWTAAVGALFAELRAALAERRAGLRGVDPATAVPLLVREFVAFSAARPQLQRIIMQECKAEGPRLDWLVEEHIRPLYDLTVAALPPAVAGGRLAGVTPVHLYYLLTGAGATMFVLGPECRRLTGLDPTDPAVVEAHAEAVVALLFGPGAA